METRQLQEHEESSRRAGMPGGPCSPAEHRPLVPGLSAAGRWPGCDPKKVPRQVGENEQSGPANKLRKNKHTNEAG